MEKTEKEGKIKGRNNSKKREIGWKEMGKREKE